MHPLKEKALGLLIERRAFPNCHHERNWRTEAAFTYLQMAMKVPTINWRQDVPPVTVSKGVKL